MNKTAAVEVEKLDVLCRWLGIDTSELHRRQGNFPISLVYGNQSMHNRGRTRWASFGDRFYLARGATNEMEKVVAIGWKRSIFCRMPYWVREKGMPTVSLPESLQPQLGPMIIDAKNRLKIFTVDHTVINIAKSDGHAPMRRELGTRISIADSIPMPRILESGERNGVPYFIESFVSGGTMLSVIDNQKVGESRRGNFVKIIDAMRPFYATQGTKSLGVLCGYIDHLAENVRTLIEGSESSHTNLINSLLVEIQRIGVHWQNVDVIATEAHRDLTPVNVLYNSGDLMIIDWELAGTASITHDAFNYANWLAVFRSDRSLITAILDRNDSLRDELFGAMADQTSLEVKSNLNAYALAYIAEKILIQIETSMGDLRLTQQRVSAWLPHWHWLLSRIAENANQSANAQESAI